MTKPHYALTGHNNNVRYKGKALHIQTEDLGEKRAQLVSLLFVDGGRIVTAVRSSYSHILDAEDLSDQLRQMMRAQHKGLFESIRGGQFDNELGLAVAVSDHPKSPPTPPALSLADLDLRGLFRIDYARERPNTKRVPTIELTLPSYLFVSDRRRSGASAAKISKEISAKTPPDFPAVGSILDKYRIEELLGTGGFASVFRATHLLLQRPVAIKLLRSGLLEARPHLADLLCEEARFAARINHPNVVRVFDVTHGPVTYVVMEFIDGESLWQRIHRNGRLAPDEVISIAIDIVRGLRAGLEQGLVHRDVKPENILITRTGEAKLVDLGLALSRVTDQEPTDQHEGYVGTFAYMAPEQARSPQSVDCRADIYSLGATLFHAIVGRPPFPSNDPAQCLYMHMNLQPPSPESLLPGLNPMLSKLLLSMLAKKLEDRPASYDLLETQFGELTMSAETRP